MAIPGHLFTRAIREPGAIRAGLLALVLVMAVANPVQAGQSPEPTCAFSPNPATAGESVTLTATNLPIGIPFAITASPYPVGTTLWTVDGTWSRTFLASPWTAYFWVRGHGPSLLKAGPQLNDYHVVAMCSLEIA